MAELIVIAGCNGAGKSTYAFSFLREGLTSFDFDKLYLQTCNSLQDSDIMDEIATNIVSEKFEEEVYEAISRNNDFCYETNFDAIPLHWPKIFKEHGYMLNLVFFCLESQQIARERVKIRFEFNGRFVDEETIDYKWKEGYKNVNEYFSFFDKILIVDNSVDNNNYKNIVQIENNQIIAFEKIPDYFYHRLPKIAQLYESSESHHK